MEERLTKIVADIIQMKAEAAYDLLKSGKYDALELTYIILRLSSLGHLYRLYDCVDECESGPAQEAYLELQQEAYFELQDEDSEYALRYFLSGPKYHLQILMHWCWERDSGRMLTLLRQRLPLF